MTEADARLLVYEDLLRRWAGRTDLVSPADLGRLRTRHIEDCARAVAILDGLSPGAAVDVGSGAGLPGIVLAILRPAWTWVLLEPRTRRAAFLEEAIRRLELDASVTRRRAEEAVDGASFDVATARALASPQRSFDLLLPLLRSGGTALVWIGSSAGTKWRHALPGIATMTA